MASPAEKLHQDFVEGPKRLILDKLGDLSHYEVLNNDVLLAIYQRPEKSAGGIIMPEGYLKEDLYQGKVHLVVKIGPTCDFPTVKINLYDWVVVRPSDGWALDVNSSPEAYDRKDFYPCRMVQDKYVKVKIPHPGMVW